MKKLLGAETMKRTLSRQIASQYDASSSTPVRNRFVFVSASSAASRRPLASAMSGATVELPAMVSASELLARTKLAISGRLASALFLFQR